MFKKTRKQISITIEGLKDGFRLFVVTVQNLTLSIENNSATVAANTAEQTELRRKFDVLVENTGYLKTAKQRELQRAGQTHQL